MDFSREIIKKVLQYVRFRVPQTEEKKHLLHRNR